MKARNEAASFVSSGIAGAVIGAELIKASGYKAAGMTGGGSGIGGKALPVGVAFGTMAGFSLWGLGRTMRAVYVDAKAHLRQSPTPEPEGPQIVNAFDDPPLAESEFYCEICGSTTHDTSVR